EASVRAGPNRGAADGSARREAQSSSALICSNGDSGGVLDRFWSVIAWLGSSPGSGGEPRRGWLPSVLGRRRSEMGAKGSGEAAGAGVADSTTHRSDRCAGAEQAAGGLHPIVQAPLPQCQSRVAEEGTLEIPGTRVTSAAHWATVRSSPGLNSSASA